MSDQIIPDAAGFGHSLVVDSPEGTARLGAAFARHMRGGEILLLYGALGAGKTCFVRGLCRELNIHEDVTSPTFTLVNRYRGRLTVNHLDFYRVEPGDDLADIGVEEILDEVASGAVLLAEWPAPLLPLLPDRVELHVSPVAGPRASEDTRRWSMRTVGSVADIWSEGFPDDSPDETQDDMGGD